MSVGILYPLQSSLILPLRCPCVCYETVPPSNVWITEYGPHKSTGVRYFEGP